MHFAFPIYEGMITCTYGLHIFLFIFQFLMGLKGPKYRVISSSFIASHTLNCYNNSPLSWISMN